MEPVSLSKRNLIGLVVSSALLTLVIGWFVGVYFFDGSGLNQSARSKADARWLNTMLGEYSADWLQDDLLAASHETLGGELSTVEYEGVDGGLLYTNGRLKFSMNLPSRVRLAKDLPGNKGIPLVVLESSDSEVIVSEAGRILEPRELVGSADRSSLPTFVETDSSRIQKTGMRVAFLSATPTSIQSVLAKRFPACQVTGVSRAAIDGSELEQVDAGYIASGGCDLGFQPFLRFVPARNLLLVANTDGGCRFFSPAKQDPVIEECLDTSLLESLTFSK